LAYIPNNAQTRLKVQIKLHKKSSIGFRSSAGAVSKGQRNSKQNFAGS